ncbi:MAG: glycosyltransferase, partial [Spartobacteria bacterium]|nr:glycosyltransferase [Spartobacteria bacterium]
MNTTRPPTCFLFSRRVQNATTQGLLSAWPLLEERCPVKKVYLEDLAPTNDFRNISWVLTDYGISLLPEYKKTITSAPTVMELRGDVLEYEYAPLLTSAQQRQALLAVAHQTQAVVTPSESSREKLLRFGIHEPLIHVLRRGVSEAAFNAPVPHPPAADHLSLVTVASLSWPKGHDRVLATCVELKNRGIPFTWTLIGDGPNHEWLTFEIKRLSLHDHVLALWQLDHIQIRERLAASHFFVQLPYSDDLAYCAMEASAQGIPVLSTAIGAMTEVYTHNRDALLFDYTQPGHAADILIAAQADP